MVREWVGSGCRKGGQVGEDVKERRKEEEDVMLGCAEGGVKMLNTSRAPSRLTCTYENLDDSYCLPSHLPIKLPIRKKPTYRAYCALIRSAFASTT
jgi:hypothetical protein